MVTRIGLDNRMFYASPSCVRVIGWSPDELLGTSAIAGIHAEDIERVVLGRTRSSIFRRIIVEGY